MPTIISLHDVLEPLKQALLESRDVMISSQICASKLQRVFTLGDGCRLPNSDNDVVSGCCSCCWLLSVRVRRIPLAAVVVAAASCHSSVWKHKKRRGVATNGHGLFF